MCQSIQITYQFCGCEGEFYQQICPKPTTTCNLLLQKPTEVKLTCYCEKHSSQTFKTVRQNRRDTARFNKEYNKILAREEQQRQKANRSSRQEGSQRHIEQTRTIRGRSQAARVREEQIFSDERNGLVGRSEREIAEFRQKESDMEAYGRKWGEYAMWRKYPNAKTRAEDDERRKAEEAILKKAGRREKSDGICVVM